MAAAGGVANDCGCQWSANTELAVSGARIAAGGKLVAGSRSLARWRWLKTAKNHVKSVACSAAQVCYHGMHSGVKWLWLKPETQFENLRLSSLVGKDKYSRSHNRLDVRSGVRFFGGGLSTRVRKVLSRVKTKIARRRQDWWHG